jgi:scyllo-inositol 2-dehydrogenase (NADP+)
MIRIAIVGLGKMGLSHLAILRTHPDIEVVAVCDSFGMLLSGLNKYAGLKTYDNFEEMLNKEPLDAVLIATPSRFHGSMVRQALEKNLHIFCEKPFCLNIAEGQALTELAKIKAVVNQVGYHYRFVAAFIEAKRLLASNLIGKIHHIRAEAYGPVVLRPKGLTWRSSAAEGGGCLYDYACHAIDLLNFLYSAPDSVEGAMLNKVFSADVDDEVYASFRFPGGATGQLAANWSDESFRKMSMQVTIWGVNGRMLIDRQEIQIYLREEQKPTVRLQRGWNTLYTTELTEPVWFYLRGEEYSMQIDHFVCCIKDRRQRPVSSFETALQTDVVVNKLIRNANGSDESTVVPFQSQHAVRPNRSIGTSFASLFRRPRSN